MTSGQTAAICATILLAALANLAGGFAIQVYFETRQAAFDSQVVRIGTRGFFADPRLSGAVDAATGLPLLRQFPGDDGPELVPLPPPTTDAEDNSAAIIGDGVGRPADVRFGRGFTPRELPDAAHAAPIQPRSLSDERRIAGIIEAELPEATAEERAVWLQQLKGLRPLEVRNMLQMRRKFGSEIPRSFDSPTSLVEPFGRSEHADSVPVIAPVPTNPADRTR